MFAAALVMRVIVRFFVIEWSIMGLWSDRCGIVGEVVMRFLEERSKRVGDPLVTLYSGPHNIILVLS